MRTERDLLGERDLPAKALYGIQTARARENFATGGEGLADQPTFIAALAHVKAAAALANADLGVLPHRIAEAIARAAREVAAGRFHDQFPLEIVQGGGGTSTNMNINEVLANRANELLGAAPGSYEVVDPYSHVNRSQSTNDVLPTAMAVAVHSVARATLTSLAHLHDRLIDQAVANAGLQHLARTCLQDAVPVPVGAVHRAQAYALARAMDDLDVAAQRLLSVPLGATAVGTGLGAPDGYREVVLQYLRRETELEVRGADDLCDGLASLEPFAALADAMARAGRVIARIAADLRLLASGPVGGIGEVALPAMQAGSSIMPGKVNPVLPELVMQISYRLAGAAHAVHLAAAAGELEVTPMGPLVTAELLGGLQRLGRAAVLFADRCIAGLAWRHDDVTANLRGSLHGAVEAAGVLGYEQAARDTYTRRAAPSKPVPKEARHS